MINVTTRSGQGMTSPKGSITTSYGSFGTADLGINLGYGGQKWGNFISASGLNSGRFLDPPEFAVFHDKGNEENVFDRVDFQLSKVDSVHVNLGFTRSWFQTPNSFDNLNTGVTDPVAGNPVGPTDQRSQIKTFNIAPSWTRLLSPNAVFTLGAFVRRDQYNYYPSDNPFSDLGPIQQETVSQDRTLANAGVRSDISYVKGIHNLKAGATYQQTFLDENTRFGIVDPALNAPCFAANGNAVPWIGSPGLNDPANCGSAVSTNPVLYPAPFTANAGFFNSLGCFDLTRPTPATADGCAGIHERPVPFQRTHRRQTTRSLCAGHDHQGKLVAQPGLARRYLQRAHDSPGSRAAAGRCLQREEDQYGSSRFLCASAGNSVQRKPGAGQHGMRFAGSVFAAGLRDAGRGDPICSGLAQRVSCRPAAGVREVCGLLRRIYLEIHAQRLRLQRAGKHSDHVPD